MSVTKMFIVFMVCLAVNFMLVAGVCQKLKDSDPVDYTRITGNWYARKVSNDLLKELNNFTIVIKNDHKEGIITGTANDLRSSSNGPKLTNFHGSYKIPEDGSPEVYAKLNLDILSGKYTVLSDYNCYLFVYGCPEALKGESSVVYFREKNPSQECVNSAEAAVKKTGFDLRTLSLDPAISAPGQY